MNSFDRHRFLISQKSAHNFQIRATTNNKQHTSFSISATMKLFNYSLCIVLATVGLAKAKPSLSLGAANSAESFDVLATNALPDVGRRQLVLSESATAPDLAEVMVKNVDCFACMEAPPSILSPGGSRALRTRELANNDVFVTALNCDASDPYQIWDLLSLEASGTWYLFKSHETGECMQVVGDCHPSGALYDIEMGPCDEENNFAIWGFTHIGEIANFACFDSNYESEQFHHSSPDIFLEAECSNRGGMDRLDLSSHSADSQDQAENYWMTFPAKFIEESPSPEPTAAPTGSPSVPAPGPTAGPTTVPIEV